MAADIKGARYPDTPKVSIGVNQSSRSPARDRPVTSPTPSGGLFSFSIPTSSISKQLTARERFQLSERSDYKKKELKALTALGVSELSEETYVTPRAQLDDKSKADTNVKVRINKEGPKRMKGLTAFFEQFNELSA